ncbi:MAG: methyl-accepting chemotaxis protein [Bacteroidota bacterium]
MVAIIFSLGFFIYQQEKKRILNDMDSRMENQVNDLVTLVETYIKQNQEQVNVSLKMANEIMQNFGEIHVSLDEFTEFNAINQETKEVHPVRLKNWKIGGKIVQHNFDLVDKLQTVSNATSTIFQKIDQGYLRISTNVLKLDGSRAVGTFIPNSSPVIQTIERGETFRGRAYVVNDWYLTAYKPIFIDGKVQGILYVGVPEKDLSDLREIFSNKKFLDTGYPFIVDKNGKMIIHPKKEGEIFSDSEFFIKIIESGENQGKAFYFWENSKKIEYFKYFEPIESYVVVSLYEKELLENIRQTRNIIFAAILLSILIFLVVNLWISNMIVKGLKKGVEFAKRISTGDLTGKLDIEQEDEVGELSGALNKMVVKLRDMIEKITGGAEYIAVASRHISSGSQQLSRGATEQASSAEEISSSMEEMAANIQQNADNSSVTEKISVKALKEVERMHEMEWKKFSLCERDFTKNNHHK